MNNEQHTSLSPLPTAHCPLPKKVLVTGSNGAIGRVVCPALLARGHAVRGLDCRSAPPSAPDPTLHSTMETVQANMTDQAAIFQAMQGMDTVLHLAAYPNDGDFIADLVEPNIIGLYHVLNAARRQNIARVILASSMQVINGMWRLKPNAVITVADGPKITNHYGLTKLFAEEMGEMYARLYGLSVLAVRIGWFPRDQNDFERVTKSNAQHSGYFSHHDCARFFTLAVEAECQGFHVLFATSKAAPGRGMDPQPARQVIGYEAQDWYPEGSPFGQEVDGRPEAADRI